VKNFAKQLKSQRKKQTNNLQQLLFQGIWIIPEMLVANKKGNKWSCKSKW